MRMRMAYGFEHFQLTGFNDSDGLRAGDGREAFQEIFNGFAAFQGVNQILQGDTRADKHGRAAHDFGIGVNDAFQIFDCHIMAKILLPAKLSPANMAAGRAPAVLRRERRWVRSPLAENSTPLWSHHSVPRSDETWLPEWSGKLGGVERCAVRSRGVSWGKPVFRPTE